MLRNISLSCTGEWSGHGSERLAQLLSSNGTGGIAQKAVFSCENDTFVTEVALKIDNIEPTESERRHQRTIAAYHGAIVSEK